MASLLLAGVLAISLVSESVGRDLLRMPVSAQSQHLRAAVSGNEELAGFYEARGYRPLWTRGDRPRPEAHQLVTLIGTAPQDGLDPERYGYSNLKAALAAAEAGDDAAMAHLETVASLAYATYAIELRNPRAGEKMVFTDAAASPPPSTITAALLRLDKASDLEAELAGTRRMHPFYESLRRELAKNGQEPARERLILANMDRARSLPANPGRRYILVDAAAAMLWMYENGRPVDSMKVVVGEPGEPTPLMAGAIRYSVFNPYWNIPESMVSRSIAPQVLREGPTVLARRNLEALSDWTPEARVLAPAEVDWQTVASGRKYLRVRQRPGPDNMMGKVKFMFPNRLGIYLHDTPNKALFGQDARWASAGCVRVEDAPRLVRWLYGAVPEAPGMDQHVDLPEPVPVYITYFTALPTGQGLTTHPDIYGRDTVKLAGRPQPAAG